VVQLWNLPARKSLCSFEDGDRGILQVALLPDQHLLSQSRSGRVSAWILRPSGAERVRELESGCESFCAFAACALPSRSTDTESSDTSASGVASTFDPAATNAQPTTSPCGSETEHGSAHHRLPSTRPSDLPFLSASPSSPGSPPQPQARSRARSSVGEHDRSTPEHSSSSSTAAAAAAAAAEAPSSALLFEREKPLLQVESAHTSPTTRSSLLSAKLATHACAFVQSSADSLGSRVAPDPIPRALLDAQGHVIVLPGTDSNTLQLWEQRSSNKLAQIAVDPSWPTPGMCMSVQFASRADPVAASAAADLLLCSTYEDGSVAIFDVRGWRWRLHTKVLKEPALSMQLDVARQRAVVAGAAAQIVVLSTADQVNKDRTEATFTLPTAGVASLHLRQDRKLFAAACWDSSVRLYAWKKPRPLAILKHHQSSVQRVVFCPRTQLLASAASDKLVSIWSIYR